VNASGARSVLLALVLLSCATVHAQATKTWSGPANGTWNTPGNWTPNGVPASGDNVIFNGSSTPNLNVNATVGNVNKTGGGTQRSTRPAGSPSP
jgi:hypothetical protein